MPLSPRTSTVARLGAACVATSTTRRQRGRAADDLAAREELDLVLERAVLRDEPLLLRRLPDALHDGHPLERLLDEVVCALAHRAHGGLDRAVRGHEDHLDVGRELLHGAQELEARRAGHHQIGEQDVDAVGAHDLERVLRVERGEDAHPFADEDFLEGLDVGALVVDDEDRDGVGGGRFLRKERCAREV